MLSNSENDTGDGSNYNILLSSIPHGRLKQVFDVPLGLIGVAYTDIEQQADEATVSFEDNIIFEFPVGDDDKPILFHGKVFYEHTLIQICRNSQPPTSDHPVPRCSNPVTGCLMPEIDFISDMSDGYLNEDEKRYMRLAIDKYLGRVTRRTTAEAERPREAIHPRLQAMMDHRQQALVSIHLGKLC